jgi:DNA-binding Lrp family transcriptional regulator
MCPSDLVSAYLAPFAIREYRTEVALKPQDVLVLLKLASRGDSSWSYPKLSVELGMSPSEVHASVRRATQAGLLQEGTRAVNRAALLEFLVHAVKYVFPPERGGISRGLPTAHSAPPLRQRFRATSEMPTVWADPEGTVRGETLEPLYSSVPHAARADTDLYEWLALVDAVRAGRARERELATAELQRRLS